MSRPYSEILAAIYRPLAYGLRKDGQNLKNISNFNSLIKNLLTEARALSLEPQQQSLIESLSLQFEDFDRQPFPEQVKRLEAALLRLEGGQSPRQKRQKPLVSAADFGHRPNSVQTGSADDSPLLLGVERVRGIGPKTAQRLQRKNVFTVEDLLFDYPLRYEDRSALRPIAQVRQENGVTIRAVVRSAQISKTYRGKRVLSVLMEDSTGSIVAKWFRYRGKVPDKRFEKGRELIVSGNVGLYQGRLEFHHPEIEPVQSKPSATGLAEERIVPIYGLTEGLKQRSYRLYVQGAARRYARWIPEVLPESLLQEWDLPPLGASVLKIHCPEKDAQLDLLNRRRSPAQRRIIFEEMFFLALSVEFRRQEIGHLPGPAMAAGVEPKESLVSQLRNLVPFRFTGAQEKVMEEIFADMAKPFAMNRLLQGDVGSGKTIVAAMAAARALENGFQVALMAPTEILAAQHFSSIGVYLEQLNIPYVSLLGATAKKVREDYLRRLEEGEVKVVIGTHAIIQGDVQFANLGLVIIDEQHRFGVLQRLALRQKGINPHCLVMTATPIPRTLAMTVYGDLDLSILNEMPAGRKPVATRLVKPQQRQVLYEMIRREVQKGHQVYVVYPLVEESENLDLKNAMDMYDSLSQKTFPELRLALLHGRMKQQEKEQIMAAFKAGEVQILVSTTVIEVGIDVPRATLMVIEHAERFGLSQLHQLRGRVGRSGLASTCILSVEYRMTEDAKDRIQTMLNTTDGFRIAEEDLRIRGPGEVLGVRQAGLPVFCYADLRKDAEILNLARDRARDLMERNQQEESPEFQQIKQALFGKWRGRLQISGIG